MTSTKQNSGKQNSGNRDSARLGNDVHALWIEGELSPLAQLTLHTFLQHHGQIRLWTYDRSLQVPDGVQLRDANRIIDRAHVFRYRHGHASGSYGGFSDLFRTRLLWRHGGWWTDMDVTLMRPIPDEFLNSEVVLRSHHCNAVVGNLMKMPAGSEAMKTAYRWSCEQVHADNTDWNKPIELLSRAVTEHGLLHYRRTIGHLDELADVLPFVRLPVELPASWWAMHWCNEMWRRDHWLLRHVHSASVYSRLLRTYQIKP